MYKVLTVIFAVLLAGVVSAQSAAPLIAYVEEGNLYLWQDGTRRALVETGSIDRVWLKPDGTRIAYTQHDGTVQKPGYDDLDIADYQYRSTSLWITGAEGEPPRQIADLDEYRGGFDYGYSVFIDRLEWVPGTSLVAFNTLDVSEVASFSSTHANLYAIDTETGRQVLAHLSDESGGFSIAPDGAHAAIATDAKIAIVALDGTMAIPALYTYERSVDTPHSNYYPQMQWAADAASLIAVDLKTRLGWTETADDGTPIYPSVDFVHIRMDGTTEVLATEERDSFNYWTLRFVAGGPQAIYSTGSEEDCGFAAVTLAQDVQLAQNGQNTVLCYGRSDYSFVALTPEGTAYRLDQRAGTATLSRVCDDFSACEAVQEIGGRVYSLDFIGETQLVLRVVADDGADIFNQNHELYYMVLGEAPQRIGITKRTFPDAVFSVSLP